MSNDPDALALTRELLAFDTRNPPGRERECADRLAGLLEAGGLRVARREFSEARTSLVARLDGTDDGPPLGFTGHIDTVPLGAAPWSRDPFAGETADGRLYGRGSSDMKSGVAAMVAAALAFAARGRPRRGVVLALTAGEETGCEGAADLAAAPEVLGTCGALVVGEPTANRPWVGHKGALWLHAVTRGVTAHGSMPERGVNAIYKAARAVARIAQFDFAAEPHPVLGPPTLNVGTIRGGMNVNSVPDEAVIGIDIRTVPGQAHDALRTRLAAHLGGEVEVAPFVDVPGVWTEPDDAWVLQVFGIMADITGEQPGVEAATYFTDASILTPAFGGVPTVVLGPGEPAMAHQTDEYCEVQRIAEAMEAYRRIMDAWCAA